MHLHPVAFYVRTHGPLYRYLACASHLKCTENSARLWQNKIYFSYRPSCDRCRVLLLVSLPLLLRSLLARSGGGQRMGQTQRSKQSKQLGIHLVKLLRALRRLHTHSRGSETKWKRGKTQLSTLQCSFRVSVTPSFCAFETATCTATARFTAAVPCKHRFYRSSGEAEFLRRLCRAQSSRATAARGRKKKESRDSSNGSSSRGAWNSLKNQWRGWLL